MWDYQPKIYAKNATIPPKNASQAMIPIIPNAPVLSDARAMIAETIQITEGRDRLIHASGMVEDCQMII
ncbi:hypothetical protein [Haloarcula sebkhae]|nr:hypothetical protein [Haloarcula sebkhae]